MFVDGMWRDTVLRNVFFQFDQSLLMFPSAEILPERFELDSRANRRDVKSPRRKSYTVLFIFVGCLK